MASPYKVRWGIMATGGIAETFVSDLLIDPTTRGADDVKHEIAAVASRSAEKAQKFIKDMKIPSSANAYGSYKELVNDPNVDVVYVATPHSHHFQNVMLCLEANKHVLCEKAFTVNAEQTKILTNEAKKRKLFLMEAVWTRYFPMCVQIRNLIKEGKIGEVLRVFADTSCNVPDPSKKYPDTNRMVNLDLAGGLLLDVVIYSLTWAFQTLYHTQPKDQRKGPCKISSQIEKYPQKVFS
ncbi:hypothetical protein KEM55_002566 [Ascosphaera atra]|nr:hypothetical protein KEM55_002566 [Ascosphaera atra]